MPRGGTAEPESELKCWGGSAVGRGRAGGDRQRRLGSVLGLERGLTVLL